MIERKHKILVVDDEEDILTMLKYSLEKEGFEVKTANNGKSCISKALDFYPDLIILDVMMPEMDGMETCVELRKLPELDQTIICFLTARTEDYSQIAGYDSGADDYVTKPVKPRVLASKIRALLRRNENVTSNSSVDTESNEITGIHIDREKYLVTVDGREYSLPKKEFELLSLLVSGNGAVFSRETILSQVWGNDIVVGDRTIDVHIRKLREKIGNDFIKTIKGVGYKFVDKK
ncbi:MAG: response regulator transcription factor [Flavobacteriales bacterium]|nr:response regulator transcription factor [Flavobacteriales bacterium]